MADEPFTTQDLTERAQEMRQRPVLAQAAPAEITVSLPDKTDTATLAIDTDYDDFWSEAKRASGGRHSRESGFVWPIGLLALVAGMLALAVAVVLIFDLVSPG
jgi:hypothetical protein